jgi:three-Cys-motif partner protein
MHSGYSFRGVRVHKFHMTKKSAAVLKLGIIDAYAPPFIGKTGSRSIDNRVAFIDGYAGPGRYSDDEEGSGAMLLRHAKKHAPMPRNVELHFVEENAETVEKLRQVVADEGTDVAVTVDDGDILTHLSALLDDCDGIPLFVYLDPCGLVIPFDEVVRIFERPSGLGSPATEVLINFSAVTLRRIAGHLTSDNAVEATLARMDDVCGGDWWREAWLDELPDKDAAEQAVVNGYAKRLSNAAGTGHWVIDVRPRVGLKPLYYLVFATRHIAGMESFGEASSLGLEKWRRYSALQEAEGTLFADDDSWEESFKAQEGKLKQEWIDAIAANLEGELAKGEPFRVIERYSEVFGDLAGVARGLHLRAAMKKAHVAGLTKTSPVGVKNLLQLRLSPA